MALCRTEVALGIASARPFLERAQPQQRQLAPPHDAAFVGQQPLLLPSHASFRLEHAVVRLSSTQASVLFGGDVRLLRVV